MHLAPGPTLLAFSALGCALMGGVFLAFSLFVMRGLEALRPEDGAAAMRAINAAALRPPFMALFFGTALACAGVVALGLFGHGPHRGPLAIAGALVYLAGGLGVTALRSVPMNERLAATPPGTAEAAALWTRFLALWTLWNHVRAVAAALAAVLLGLALAR
ncbi:MAG: DUF1772 domain-containing protein [Anaeromyxobacteraceae bacterium]